MSVTIGYCAGKEHHLQINDGRATIKVWFIIFPCVVVWGCCPLQHNIVVIACVMYLNVSCVCRLFIIGPLPADAAANNQNMPKVTLVSCHQTRQPLHHSYRLSCSLLLVISMTGVRCSHSGPLLLNMSGIVLAKLPICHPCQKSRVAPAPTSSDMVSLAPIFRERGEKLYLCLLRRDWLGAERKLGVIRILSSFR